MRSNIARPCPSSRVPLRAAPAMRALGPAAFGAATFLGVAPALGLALELGQEGDERLLLLHRQLAVGRHRRRRVLERALDRALRQDVPDVGQLRPGPVVAVLTDLVAGQTAGLRGDELTLLVLRRDLVLDLVRRSGRRAEVGEGGHGA